ncbi:MAG: cytidine/deoxycytidylate deaminase family protein [archaeon]
MERANARMTWDEYFMSIVENVAKRATCDMNMNGAIIVKDKRILSTGYAGAPTGLPHCSEAGHMLEDVRHADGVKEQQCLRVTHAAINAIVQAAKHGIKIDGATTYCKIEPCLTCAKAIINAGIKRVVALRENRDSRESRRFFGQASIRLEIVEPGIEEWEG